MLVDEKIDALLKRGVENYRAEFEAGFSEFVGQCESPIERLLAAAFYVWQDDSGRTLDCMDANQESCCPHRHAGSEVHAQFQLDDWRCDFLVVQGEDIRVIVECDGFDFHERTPEQAERDRDRDRKYQQQGYAVFRFTGREIVRDVDRCVAQVIDMIDERIYRHFELWDRAHKSGIAKASRENPQ